MKNLSVPPALVLFFLSPMLAELLSGSAPPAEFFNPFILVLLSVLYGSGAVIARELKIRWGKGWPSLFVLGAAYGIVEEGLMVKSFFDPNWVDLGILGTYGRWEGVNWVWSLELTIFHAVFSIAIPVLIVEIIFPAQRLQSWISIRMFKVLGILLTAEVIFGYLFLTSYRPPVVPYVLALIAVIGLIILAKRLPHPVFKVEKKKLASPRWFALTGCLVTLAFFIINWLLPNSGIHPVFTMLLTAALASLVALFILKSGVGFSEVHKLALVSGALCFFILLAPLQELDKTRTDNPAGMTFVAIAAAAFLLWMNWRVRSIKAEVQSG